MRVLFEKLLEADNETAVEAILDSEGLSADDTKWTPYGDNESFYGVIENQQAHPVPALVEKVTNGIDAILEKKVLQDGLDSRSSEAPGSVQEALDRYFPGHRNWDLGDVRRQQARDLQIVASGPKMDTSLLIYDNGVGQAPEDFASTFLSLLRGNKNDVHFVQGKYNMGGSGAIAFCGDLRYQLVASKRYDGSSPLGFTLLRRHPPHLAEAAGRKNTWYEYLVFDGNVPFVDIGEIDVGLEGRKFTTGSLLKLYSYRLPSGSRSIISRDLNRSLNEFLFEPALPFLTVDNEERYPDNNALATPVYGLKRRLENDGETVERHFSLESDTVEFGKLTATVYVFKARSRGKGVRDTKRYLENEYFKNSMAVLFSLNGQVHGSYTSEFITRTLKIPLLKGYVLIHLDCSALKLAVRNELFMASRDRLKSGDTANALRRHLSTMLSNSELKDIAKRRRAGLSVDGEDAGQLLREVTRNLPMNDAMTRILRQTFDLTDPRSGTHQEPEKKKRGANNREKREIPPFDPKRYPTIFSVKGGEEQKDGTRLFTLPKGSSRTIAFATDVENEYFDRSDEPGTMVLDVMAPGTLKRTDGPKNDYEPSDEGEMLDIIRASPEDGTIKVGVRASAAMDVGQVKQIHATLSSPQGALEQVVMVRITDPERKPPVTKPDAEPPLGIPELVLCQKDAAAGMKAWEELGDSGVDMDYDVVVFPLVEDDKLSRIYINIDSTVLKDFRSKLKTAEASELAERRYISAVYFHTLFLFATTKARNYHVQRGAGDQHEPIDLADYISDLFSKTYAQFLINFDTADLLDAMS